LAHYLEALAGDARALVVAAAELCLEAVDLAMQAGEVESVLRLRVVGHCLIVRRRRVGSDSGRLPNRLRFMG